MRSNGLATVLLMVPVLTVPALAIFGIPQFAPVVASPLDEGQDFDRDLRGGKSSKQSSRDDFFEEVEGFGATADDEPPPKKRKSGLASSLRRESTRRSKDSDAPGWSDDLSSSSDLPAKRRPAVLNADDVTDQDAVPAAKLSRRPASSEKLFRDKQRPSANSKIDGAIRLASADDTDRAVVQSAFENESPPEVAPAISNEARGRMNDLRRTKRRESSEPLSWATAVDRLNQLDVRNFRLEPGSQLGQFIFICAYTPPDNPGVMHRFEAEADQPLKAVENVLDQIVEWQQRR